MFDKETQTRYFRVTTEETRGGYSKSRQFVARVTKEEDAEDSDFFGYAKYLYHQTVRGVLGYDSSNVGDKHTLVKQGNTLGIEEIEEISYEKFLDLRNKGVRELEKQQ
jgi:hypothetical protein